MASATREKDENVPAADMAGGGPDEPRGDRPIGTARGGFFSVYKPNQGRTTRVSTGIAAALLIGLSVHFLLTQVPAWFDSQRSWGAVWTGIVVVLGLVMSALAWRLINRPDHAEFLIATDSEMKKVNWTSRKALWGSTKVVISFMLMIALILFVVDMIFHWLFYLIDVLKFKPFGL